MGKPITTNSGGICFAFPNVCKTQVGPATVPIPYPSVGQLADATGTASTVLAGNKEVVTVNSSIPSTSGDEPALPVGGVVSNNRGGGVEFQTGSGTVKAEGHAVVRMLDTTGQNLNPAGASPNATGVVLGGFPSVLVGD